MNRQTSSGTGSIATTYMGVLLYSVAGLACEFNVCLDPRSILIPFSFQVHWLDSLSDCTTLCGRVGASEI